MAMPCTSASWSRARVSRCSRFTRARAAWIATMVPPARSTSTSRKPTPTLAATCSSSTGGNVNCGTGATVSGNAGSNFLIYWDADEARELEDDTSITKSGGGTLLSASGCASNNGTKSTPTLTADLLGDWREELVLRESNNSALRVYTTTDVTKRRIYTLMHDPHY